MHKINRALLPDEKAENSFQRLVNSHIEEVRAHKHRLAMVEKTKHLKDGDPNKWTICPPPMAHPDIVNSIVEDGDDYNIQYELFDDTPELTLDEKKNQLSVENGKLAHAAQEKIIPNRKRTLFSLKASEALDVPEKDQTDEHRELIKRRKDIGEKSRAIILHHATMEDEIHDLTEKNIDSWKPKPYPEV